MKVSSISKKLVENSISAMLSAIEIHNKPNFQYRYETVVILIINARESLIKWYLYKYHKDVKLWKTKKWKTEYKPFDSCLACIKSKLWKDYEHWFANIERIYDYRCSYIHFYWDNIDPIIFWLINENVKFYADFLTEFFPQIKFKKENFYILPIWFEALSSTINILSDFSKSKESSKDVKKFIQSIIDTSIELSNHGNDNCIISDYKIKFNNINSLKNADIVAKFSNDWILVNNSKKIEFVENWDNNQQVRVMNEKEEIALQKKKFPLAYNELRSKITEKYWYKNRSTIYKELKKYKNDRKYTFQYRWDWKTWYSLELVDVIWKSFPDNPRKLW